MNVALRRSIATAAVALAVPVVSSCVANFNTTTEEIYNPGEGVNNRDGSIDVLSALVVSGSEGSGTIIAGLVNNDEANEDALTEVTGAGEDASLSVEAAGSTPIGAGGFYQLADEGNVTVTGDQIQPGALVRLTFTFERGESVTLDVPVVTNTDDFADVPVS